MTWVGTPDGMPVVEQPVVRRRRVRRGAVVLILAIALSASGLVIASAASFPARIVKPLSSICLGSGVQVGIRGKTATSRKFRIQVLNAANQTVWSKAGRTSLKWKRYTVVPTGLGTHKVVYKVGKAKRVFKSSVLDCTPPPPVPVDPGPLVLTDSADGFAALYLDQAKPGQVAESCLLVTYSGAATVSVRMYGQTAGSGLDPYLDLTVTRGTLPSLTVGSCSGFVPDATSYVGAGPGVLYKSTLAGFPDDYAAGLVDPEPWTDGERHAYRFRVSVRDENAAQGRNASQSFVWEARSS